MSKIDLHIHSTASDDGEYTPREIVTMCRNQGIELAAITDHNSVRSVAAAQEAAQTVTLPTASSASSASAPTAPSSLRILSGVELDCTHNGRNFHLLGYGFDHARSEFARIEQDILDQEKAASREKIRLFQSATGIPLDEEEVMAASDDGVVPGELIAEILLSREDAGQYELLHPYLPGGSKSDMPNVRFYWDFFSAGKAAYVPIRYISLSDAVSLIHSAGGIAVLAHPGQNLDRSEAELLDSILACGVDGIEAFSSYHSRETAEYYVSIAERKGLLVTCGSDFHGKHKPAIQMGGHGAFLDDRMIMENLYAALPKKAQKR